MNRKLFIVILILTALAGGFVFYGMLNVFKYAPVQTEGLNLGSGNINQNVDIVDQNVDIGDQEGSLKTFNVLIAGDSIARGRGDQGGMGLVKAFPEEVDQRELNIINAGIDGLVSSELQEVIGNPILLKGMVDVDVVIISIGGNDLRRLVAGAFRGEVVDTSSTEYQDALSSYLGNLRKVITAIRAENKSTRIIVLGLFNPFEAEELQGFISRDIQLEILSNWNFETKQLVEQDALALVVPLYDLFKWNTNRFLSFDFIHPNDLGYQMISERIEAVLIVE